MKTIDSTRFEKIVADRLRSSIVERHSRFKVVKEEEYPDALRSGMFYSPDLIFAEEGGEKEVVIELVDSVRFRTLPYAMLNKVRAIRDEFSHAEVVLLTSSEISPSLLKLLEGVDNVTVIQESDVSMAVEKIEKKISDIEGL